MGTKKHEPDNLRYGYTCCRTVRIVNYTQLRHVKLDKQQIQNFVGKPHKNCLLKGRRKGTKLTFQQVFGNQCRKGTMLAQQVACNTGKWIPLIQNIGRWTSLVQIIGRWTSPAQNTGRWTSLGQNTGGWTSPAQNTVPLRQTGEQTCVCKTENLLLSEHVQSVSPVQQQLSAYGNILQKRVF